MEVREPAVSGMFYPSDPLELAREVDALLAGAHDAAEYVGEKYGAKAVIAPHAGYMYSGKCAANAYAIVSKQAIERVVLVGPSHRVFLDGVAAPTARVMRTPLGDIEVDHEALDRAGVPRNDAPHLREHSLEVHLPFLQRVFPRARCCPIACGDASARAVARVIESLWGGPETLVVVSTDLSHYLDVDACLAKDRLTAEKIVSLDAHLDGDEACGYVGTRGLLALAKEKNLACRLLDLRNSSFVSGDRSRVVGYGAFALVEKKEQAS